MVMFFIVDRNNNLMRSHPRWGSPDMVCMQYPHDHALSFKLRASAVQMLDAWKFNNQFEGRVIDRAEAIAISEAYTNANPE